MSIDSDRVEAHVTSIILSELHALGIDKEETYSIATTIAQGIMRRYDLRTKFNATWVDDDA